MMMWNAYTWLYKGHINLMGHINFEDHALIKRWQIAKKMNVMGGKFKDEKNGVVVESYFCLLLEVMSIFEVI